MRPFVLLIACCVALPMGGCFQPFASRNRGRVQEPAARPVRMPGARAADSTTFPAGVARKAVRGKRDPNVLIAIDGDLCTVSEQRYRDTRYGERVWCAWRPASASR